MSRVPLVDRTDAPAPTGEVLEEIQATFGTVPAMFAAVANSPATLRAMWAAFGAYGNGALGSALGERIAVAVANRNACEYCLAAHTALGRKAGLSVDDLSAAQVGDSDDPPTEALLKFALDLVDKRGQVNAADVQAVRDAGWSDEQIVETIGQVALSLFTNYINVALDVPLDFPAVGLRSAG